MALVWPSHLVNISTRMWTLLSDQISSMMATHPLGKIKIVSSPWLRPGAPLYETELSWVFWTQTQGLKGTFWVGEQSWPAGCPEPWLLIFKFMLSLPAIKFGVARFGVAFSMSQLYSEQFCYITLSRAPRVYMSTRSPCTKAHRSSDTAPFLFSTGRE